MAESEEEVDVLVRRVVKDITNAFKKNPNIDEIGLIPCVEARYNRSPIVLEDNKLGVESWCVKFLLPYVHNKLLQHRQRKHWLDPEALVDITCTLLLLNPDFTTAWNVRKELVQCGTLNPEKDLYLGKLALTKFPKSPETWIHRRWVLQRVMRECCVLQGGGQRKQRGCDDEPPPQRCDAAAATAAERSQQLAKRLARTLRQEMRVCADAADRYPSNYNAWSHRIWVLQHMAQGNVKVLQEELSSMRTWVSMHVSDHSGFHYRQFLLKTLARQAAAAAATTAPPGGGSGPQAPLQANGEASEVAEALSEEEEEEEERAGLTSVHQLFHQELELCTDLIQSYPGHETLWCHRRSVFYLWHHWRTEQQQQRPGGAAVNGGAHHHHARTPPPAPAARTDQPGKGGGSDSSSVAGGGCGTVAAAVDTASTTNRLPQASEAMDVDAAGGGGVSLPDPRDTKRLKRGPSAATAAAAPAASAAVPPPAGPPAAAVLSFERSFVRGILDGCHGAGPDQRRFAVAYEKWLDAVIGQ